MMVPRCSVVNCIPLLLRVNVKNFNFFRGILTAVTGAATVIGVIPEAAAQAIVENATTAVGSVLTLWGVVASLRSRK
jgi:hypothetical protein